MPGVDEVAGDGAAGACCLEHQPPACVHHPNEVVHRVVGETPGNQLVRDLGCVARHLDRVPGVCLLQHGPRGVCEQIEAVLP
ncbi:hypothetical protein FXN61_15470 [Lentzea sp. PSKA42]|uniref:Uncharacterized protein n=1 Tax=Lentzea indica TaxID=2604800 RepID=A0ABX1FGR5_9PSEU|nr:hypothetical protein [Lentzea indica]